MPAAEPDAGVTNGNREVPPVPLTDAALIDLLLRTAGALDEEAAWLVDVDVDDHGRAKPTIPAGDRGYFEAVAEQAAALRELVELVRARRRG